MVSSNPFESMNPADSNEELLTSKLIHRTRDGPNLAHSLNTESVEHET